MPEKDYMNKMFTTSIAPNCGYTTAGGQDVQVSVPALLKLMRDMPTKPKILGMNLELVSNEFLPENTILMSMDLAKALEDLIRCERGGEEC